MTQQDEEYAMERLKNMPSVGSILEMAEELDMKEDRIAENDETAEYKSRKMAASELEAVIESLAPFSEEGVNHEIMKEHGIDNVGGKEVVIDPSEPGKYSVQYICGQNNCSCVFFVCSWRHFFWLVKVIASSPALHLFLLLNIC